MILPSVLKNNFQGISSNFITQSTVIADTKDIGIFINVYSDADKNKKSSLYLRVDNTIATDVDTLKSWLASKYNSGSPVIVEYVLDTPADLDNLPITDKTGSTAFIISTS